MLTQDENIVEIELVVQYQISEADDYLFNVRDPDNTLRQATESALRDVVGNSKMDRPMESSASSELTKSQAEKAREAEADEDNPGIIQDILTTGRAEAAEGAKVLIQEILNRYETGLIVRSVNMQDAQPPEAVQAAFADAIKAREDEQRQINKAEAYSNEVIQRAGGIADQRIQEAEAYKAQVTAQAKGESQRFLKVLTEYTKAPDITRERLYIETMENVMGNVSKIMVDVSQGNQMLFLPLDRIIGNNMSNSRVPTVTISPEPSSGSSSYDDGRYQDDLRRPRGSSDRRGNR
ncbi:MAG: FtsH protease activity modulator HflK [Pseudomonadota bacterium]